MKIAIENNWKNVLILEDDASFINYEEEIIKLENLIKKDYDVILLGGSFKEYNEETNKLKFAQSCVAYLVSNHYYSTLLDNFEDGLKNSLFIDLNWTKLQSKDNWYVLKLITQKPGYSNIINGFADYTDYF